MRKSTTFQGKAKPFGKGGHFYESRRHSLQAKGIKTGNLSSIAPYFGQGKEVLRQSGKYAGEPEKLARMMETDSDKDGVPDVADCDPLDPNKQDDDLELKDLGQYYGTEAYHKISPFSKSVGTDGVAYIMNNGYHWFVSDMIIAISMEQKLKNQPFLAVKLKVNPDKSAVATVEDGNNKVLYTQKYKYTDAKRNLTLYHTDNVLMLSGEY